MNEHDDDRHDVAACDDPTCAFCDGYGSGYAAAKDKMAVGSARGGRADRSRRIEAQTRPRSAADSRVAPVGLPAAEVAARRVKMRHDDDRPDDSVNSPALTESPRTAACRGCKAALNVRPRGRPPARCLTCRRRYRNEASRLVMAKRRDRMRVTRAMLSALEGDETAMAAMLGEQVLAAVKSEDFHDLMTALGFRKVRTWIDGGYVDAWTCE